jgi:GT2 family glycosyltransferase
MQSPVISFVIITWNSGNYLGRCLDALIARCKAESLEFEVILIDNGSTDDTGEICKRYRAASPSRVEVIYLDSNRGTTYPRNLGLKKARGQHICILDSDAEILDGSLLEVLKALEGQEDVGMIAPRLVLPDGSVQNSVKRFPAFWHKLLKLPGILLDLPLCNADFYEGFPFPQEKEVDAAISACWFFRRDLVQSIGYLDEKIFYSPEDLDYCLRVRKAHKKVVYFPTLTVLHHTQQISHKNPLSLLSISHFFGLLYYFRKHGGWVFSPSDWEVN